MSRRKSAERPPKEREIIDEAAPFTEAQWHRLRDWWRSLPVRVSSDGVASRADAAKRLRGKR